MSSRLVGSLTFFTASLLVSLGIGGRTCAWAQAAASPEASWPRSVLLTNDDGIDDPGLNALAHAFSRVAETVVVAPTGDRSGSTHIVSVFTKYILQVQERSLGEGIRAYAVDGYPGDCVLLALRGLLVENPPDLVVSGINGGPNLGDDWLASGTIGAARLAAAWGVPAIAVSGLAAGTPEAAAAVADCVVRLARSDLARGLGAGRYLTVSFPRTDPSEFKGVRIAERAGGLLDFRLRLVEENISGPGSALWALQRPQPIPPADSTSDAALYREGYVIIVPMRADEHDRELLSRLRSHPVDLLGCTTSDRAR